MITIQNLLSYPLDMELSNGWNYPNFKQIRSGFYESINKAINPFFFFFFFFFAKVGKCLPAGNLPSIR